MDAAVKETGGAMAAPPFLDARDLGSSSSSPYLRLLLSRLL